MENKENNEAQEMRDLTRDLKSVRKKEMLMLQNGIH